MGASAVAYTAEISRTNPSCFLILIDQSGSMEDPFGGSQTKASKAEGASDAVNRLLQNLAIKCAKSEGIRDYFYVGIIGYGDKVGSVFQGELAGSMLLPISAVANAPLRVEDRTVKVPDGAGGLVDAPTKFPIWLDPVCHGGTPMCQAFRLAREALAPWVEDHQQSFPPTVINITDGESTDGDPSADAAALRSLATSDGETLLFNCHLSSSRAQPVVFHDSEDDLADKYAKPLFSMSSVLPEPIRQAAEQERFAVTADSRGFAFNADLQDLIQFLDIGTRPSNLR